MTTPIQNIPLGLCQCGCGQKTKIPERNHAQNGWTAGVPMRFIYGHHKTHRRHEPPIAPEGYKYISLTRGQFAFIDEEDYGRISAKHWVARWSRHGRCFYALSGVKVDGRKATVLMHRFILGIEDPSIFVDHINHDTLDNRRSNLRVATRSQNGFNRGKQSDNKSGYKGVCKRRDSNRWVAKINGKCIGYFKTPEEAARAYDHEAVRLHGEFAWLNFPSEHPRS